MSPLVVASFVFTDLVGSTELASSMSRHDAETLRSAHFAALRSAVARHGGREVKSLGDGVMVVVGTATGALDCAVAMQQAVAAHNQATGSSLAVRIGVAAGEATEDRGDYFGDPVVEAARLCQAAGGGQILAGEAVRLLAGRRGPHRLVALGDLDLKGLPGPVPAYEVRWEPLRPHDSGAIPLPVRLAAPPVAGFIGRHDELDLLDAAAADARSRPHATVVLVSGEAGIGKTALLAEWARRRHADGATVLYGHADEGLDLPYQPFGEALAALAAHDGGAELSRLADGRAPELSRVVPELASPQVQPTRAAGDRADGASDGVPADDGHEEPGAQPPWWLTFGSDPDAERHAVGAAVAYVLERAAAERQVVVILDDLQWADRPSLVLVEHLVSSTAPVPLVVACAYRGSELPGGRPLANFLAGLRRQEGVTRLDLSGWDDADVAAFMEAGSRERLDPAATSLGRALRRETDGNPFFVAEILRHLTESGHVRRDGSGRWEITGDLRTAGLPQSIHEVVAARVGSLGPLATDVLSAAAVIGNEFDVRLLAATCERPLGDVLGVLGAAQHASLVREVAGAWGAFAFTHGIYRRTLYDRLGSTRASWLHLRAAEWLDAAGAEGPAALARLAFHWSRAAATGLASRAAAIDACRRAGEASLAALLPDAAARWFSEALSLVEQGMGAEDRLRCELLVGLGDAQRRSGDSAHRATLLQAGSRARALGDDRLLVRAALAIARPAHASRVGGVDAERLALWEAALSAVGEDRASEARLRAAIVGEQSLTLDWPARRTLAEAALEAARRSEDPATLVAVLNATTDALRVPDTLTERLHTAAEAGELARRLGDPVGEFWATYHRYTACMEAARPLDADACVARMAELGERLAQPEHRDEVRRVRTIALLTRGDLAGAEEALGVGPPPIADWQLSAEPSEARYVRASQLAEIRRQQGRLAEAGDLLAAMSPALAGMPAHDALIGELLAESGDPEAGRAGFERAAASRFESVPYDRIWLVALSAYSRTCARRGDRSAAAALFEKLLPWRAQVAFTGAYLYGAVAHYLGVLATMLSDFDRAERLLGEALGVHRRFGAPYWEGETRLATAAMLLSRGGPGDRGVARAHLRDVLELAERRGFGSLALPARDMLERHSPSSFPSTLPAGVAEGEHRDR